MYMACGMSMVCGMCMVWYVVCMWVCMRVCDSKLIVTWMD